MKRNRVWAWIVFAIGASYFLLRMGRDLRDVAQLRRALRIWQEKLAGAPVPFGAVRSRMAIPGVDVVMDMWAYNAKGA